jgi:predicted dehydrogenase
MFDMGPYYLTALVSLLGPAVRVTGSARASFAQRTITSAPRRGQTIEVEVPTHVTGIVDFAQGAIATIVTSFDVWATVLPSIELYGTRGTLQVPDPNGFGGPVRVREAGSTEWRDVQLTHPHAGNARGLGVADMAHAIQTGHPHRASGELAYHVLDIMHAIHDASSTARHVVVQSTCTQPAPLPLDLAEYTLDD